MPTENQKTCLQKNPAPKHKLIATTPCMSTDSSLFYFFEQYQARSHRGSFINIKQGLHLFDQLQKRIELAPSLTK
jgi:hypothetical protein